MNRRKWFAAALIAGLALNAVSVSGAEPAKTAGKDNAPAAAQPEMKLPPGWTEADMKAYAEASTPGKEQQRLARDAGVWQGKNTMWMYAGAEPVSSECTYTVTPIMDGRYIKGEMAGDMPGMGPFNGFSIPGFDYVSQKYACSWIDSASTGILQGVGERSADGKTLKWTFSYHCPVTKKPAVMRQVETSTSADTKTLEMFSADPKSGKEYKMMSIEFTRKGGTARAAK